MRDGRLYDSGAAKYGRAIYDYSGAYISDGFATAPVREMRDWLFSARRHTASALMLMPPRQRRERFHDDAEMPRNAFTHVLTRSCALCRAASRATQHALL